MYKIITNQISPNLTSIDSIKSFFGLFSSKKNIDFSLYFQTKNYLLTNAARIGLVQIINIIKLDRHKKIGIPAFICAVVATPFLEAGYEICWIDTDEYGLISIDDFQNKISEISILIVPHIFGQKAPSKNIYKLAKQHKIIVIEDAAHYFDTDLSACDFKICSFGREKIFSCVSGGAVLWKEESIGAQKLAQLKLPSVSFWWQFQHICQPAFFSMTIFIWNFLWLGKIITFLFRKFNLIPLAVSHLEKKGQEDLKSKKLPYSLQKMLYRQFEQCKQTEEHRKHIAIIWKNVLEKLFPNYKIIIPPNYSRVILITPIGLQKTILAQAKKIGFLLREWDGVPISPQDRILDNFGYTLGQCPNAEYFAQNYVTFPTNKRIQKKDVLFFQKHFCINFQLLGVRIDSFSRSVLEEKITKALNGTELINIATVNPEFLLEATKNNTFFTYLQNTTLNICDGFGISFLSKIFYKKKIIRITGVEVAEILCKIAAKTNKSVFFLGGKKVAKTSSQQMKIKYPNLKVAGYLDGDELSFQEINESNPDIVLVAFGAPKQELWIQKYAQKIPSIKIAVGVGGTFDFWSEKIRRAPKWMQKCGIEWLFRLYLEPQKRWKRIWMAVIIFPLTMIFKNK